MVAMGRTGSQKVLMALSIVDIVLSVPVMLATLLVFYTLASGDIVDSSAAAQLYAQTDMTPDIAIFLMAVLGVLMLAAGVLLLVTGICGVRAARDARRIGPLWWASVIGLAVNLAFFAATVFGSSLSADSNLQLVLLVLSGATFWAANNVRMQASYQASDGEAPDA